MTATAGAGVVAPASEGAARTGLEIRGLRKWYGDTRALDGFEIHARPGEILGIAGPNGAGKSTLIKILAGEAAPDSGQISLDGMPWTPRLDRDRVAVVHQEPQLFPNLTVGDNMMVGREGTRVLRRELTAEEHSLMKDLAIDEYAPTPLLDVPLAIQQRVEIGRALARDARIFLFDEPNSALTPEESDDLFRRMHALGEAGRVVILVSHRIAELARHADRVALILDGRCVSLLEGDALTQEAIASGLVVGQMAHEPTEVLEGLLTRDEVTVLRLSGWTHPEGAFEDVQVHVPAGAIVAFMGVEGSGARELVRSMAGFEPGLGRVEIAGRQGAAAIGSESSLVSADRQTSLFPNLTIRENMVSRLSKEITAAGGRLRHGRMSEIANKLRDAFRVKTRSVNLPIRSLSGGNQQKVAIAAAIVERPELLVLEEPTRGVDVSSKREIYRLMREYANQNHAVAIYCTEVPEAFEAADVVYVVSDGRLSEPLVVGRYEDVDSLARAVTRLERHTATAAPSGA